MAELEPLGVVYAEVIERIVRRTQRSSGAGRYLAIGASAAMRERVHAALREGLGPDRVVLRDLSSIGEDDDPWNVLRQQQVDEGLGTRGVLFVVCGLRALRARAVRDGRPDPYGQLNLARDAWGSTGTHLMIWLEGLAEFNGFLEAAADLWSHRDTVAWFLSREDFRHDGPQPTPDEGIERRLAAAKATLAREGATPLERVLAAEELTYCLVELGRLLEAWEAAEIGEWEARGLQLRDEEAPGAQWALAMRLASLLGTLGRRTEGAEVVRAALTGHRFLPEWAREQADFHLANLVPHEHGLVLLHGLFADNDFFAENAPSELRAKALHNLGDTCACLGRIAEARRTAARLPRDSDADRALTQNLEATIAGATGDRAAALRTGEAALAADSARGWHRLGALQRAEVARRLDDLGATAEAAGLLAEPDPTGAPDPLTAIRTEFLTFELQWCRGAPDVPARLDGLLVQLRALLPRWISRGFVLTELEWLVSRLDGRTTPEDPLLPALEALLHDASRIAREDRAYGRDPQVVGHCTWLLADLALLRGDRRAAWKFADGVVVSWARRFSGRASEVQAWCLLARAAPDLVQSLNLARRAVTLADQTPSIFAQIRARETLARVSEAAGDRPAALAALGAAQALALAEGLLDDQLRLLHTLAELPGHPDAATAAESALVLARSQMLPREEARALLNLFLLDPHRSDPIRGRAARRHLDRAAALAEVLGPPILRARTRAAVAEAGVIPKVDLP